MIERKARNLFGAGCFAAALALTWAGAALPEKPRNASVDVSSIDDHQEAGTGMCPVQQTEPPPLTGPPIEARSAVPEDQPPATVQNLRRADRR